MWCLDPYVCNGFLVSFLEFCQLFQFTVVQLDSEVQSQYIWTVRILVSCQTTFSLRVATHYRLHVAATCRGSRSLLVHRSGDMLRDPFQRKLFRVYWSLCLRNRILLPQQFAQIQIHLILRYLWPLSKERRRNGIFGFGRARNETRARSLTLVSCSLSRNRTETLATQAKCFPTLTLINCWGFVFCLIRT